MNKIQLREKYRQQRINYADLERSVYNSLILGHIISLDEFKKSEVVTLYYPTKGEVDLTAIFRRAPGKRYCFPKCMPDGGLEFYEVERVTDLEAGSFGIMEPRSICRHVPAQEIDFMLVPGLVFGRNMHRIGYGKGYYDRGLSRAVNSTKCGVTYAFQIEDSVPGEDHDIPMDLLICEKGIIRGE